MQGDRYSQFVGWLKILLPLAALTLLSTLFLIARAPVQTEVPVAAIEELARSQHVSSPRFAGVAGNGAAVSLTAVSIRPDGRDSLILDGFDIQIDTPAGERVDITASRGLFNGESGIVNLTGLARLVTSTGYEVESAGLAANLREGSVVSHGALAARAPFGALEAGAMQMHDGGDVMVFNEGVRLLYQPQMQGAQP